MTLTARATEFVVKNRILMYVLATLALSVYLLLAFSPASLANTPATIKQPGAFMGDAVDNCRYLTFCRWDNLAQTGQPPVIGLPVVFITNMFFALGQFAFFCIGQMFLILTSFDLYYRMIYFGDGLFASVGQLIRDPTGKALPLVIIAGVAVIAFASFFPKLAEKLDAKRTDGKSQPMIVTALWSTIGLVLFFLMTMASAQNHTAGSGVPIAVNASDSGIGSKNTTAENAATKLAHDPNNWAFFSLGWAISSGNVAANWVGDIVNSVIVGVSDKLTFSNSAAETSDCRKYIDGMHSLYKGGTGGIDPVVFSLENLYQKTMLNQYVQSTFGSSTGADNAWCRILELNQPVGDQVLISKAGDVYGAITTTVLGESSSKITAMSDFKNLKWKTANEEGTVDILDPTKANEPSIKGNPAFGGEDFGAGWAISIFAPPNVDSNYESARSAHRAYFAACKSSGSTMVLNAEEWSGVVPADEEFKDWVLNDTWCNAVVTGTAANDSDHQKGASGAKESVGFWKEARGVPGANAGNSPYEATKWIRAFAYNNGQSDQNIITTLFSGGGKDLSPRFIAAPGGLGGQAYLYYTTSSGIQYGAALLSSFIMLITVYLVARLIIPVIAGGTLAQLIGGFSLLGIAISLLYLMIWPSNRAKKMNVKLVGVAIGGSLVSTIFSAIFSVFAALFGFTTSIFYTKPTPQNFGIVANANAIGLVVASIVSYYIMKMLLKKTLNFDATNLKSAMGSSAQAVMAPMAKGHDSLRDAAAAPFNKAAGMFKTPEGAATDTGWAKLRNAGATAASNTADLISRKKSNTETSSKSPKGATSTNGNKNGTMKDPLVGTIIDPKGGSHGSAYGNGPASPNQLGTASSSTLTDDQHRKRLLDQLKGNYGTADMDKVFPQGLPPDYEKKIAEAPIGEILKLSKALNLDVGGIDKDRATPEDISANMLRMRQMGEDAMKANPMGFDPSVGYAERAATQANMFRNVRPVSDHDLSQLSDAELASYNRRQFDVVGDALPDHHVVSFDGKATGIRGGDVSRDALTQRSVPNAVVRSGSQNLAAVEGVTSDGSTLYGAQRGEDGSADWNISTLNSGSRQLPPSMLSGGQVPPAGVEKAQWDDVQDMHSWINENGMTADSTAIASWPQPRQIQAGRVAEIMGGVMKSHGVNTVNAGSLTEMASTGVGISQSEKEGYAFGSASQSGFNPSTLRNILATGSAKIDALRSASSERVTNALTSSVNDRVSLVESTLKDSEKTLNTRLSESLSLEKLRAESQWSGLLAALETKNRNLSDEISSLISNGRWDDVVESLSGVGDDEDDDNFYETLRGVAEESQARVSDMKRQHKEMLEGLYENAARDREDIIQEMHRDIETQLEYDIQNHISGVQELAFAEAPETVRSHVEGMMNWFPALRDRFGFGGHNNEVHVDARDVEDADSDGIPDEMQRSL